MLFPGHKRSQRLLEDVGEKRGRLDAQGPANNDQKQPEAQLMDFDFNLRDNQIQKSTTSSPAGQKQNAEAAPPQTRAKPEDEWPNGKPPTGPRRYLQHDGQRLLRRQSSASTSSQRPVAEASIYTPNPEGTSSLFKLRIGSSNFVAGKEVVKSGSGGDTSLECLDEANSCINEGGQNKGPIRGEANLTAAAIATKTYLVHESKQNSDARGQSDIDVPEYLPPRFVCLPGEISVPKLPLLPSRLPSTTTDIHAGEDVDLGAISPRSHVKKAENPRGISRLSSQGGIRHRDIAYVTKNGQRWCNNETESVTATSESATGKYSSSSMSSSLRRSRCHVCKKPRFREPLKECFECSRHYHKGCANPKDRITEDIWVCRRCLNKLAKRPEQPTSLGSGGIGAQFERIEESGEMPASARTICSKITTNESKDLTSVSPPPQPPPTVPSIFDRGSHNSSPMTISVPLHGSSHRAESSDPYHGPVPCSTDRPECDTVPRRPLSPQETLVLQQSPAGDDNAIRLNRKSYSNQDHPFRVLGELIEGSHSGSKEEAKRSNHLLPTVERIVAESPHVLAVTAQPSDDYKTTREEIPCTTENLARKAKIGNGCDSISSIKKPCIHCQKLIVGSASVCKKCGQMKDEVISHHSKDEDSNKSSGLFGLPTTAMAVPPKNSLLPFASNRDQCILQESRRISGRKDMACEQPIAEVSPTETFDFREDGIDPLTALCPRGTPNSPFVPETPELVTKISSKAPGIQHDETAIPMACQSRYSKPTVSQKRPILRSAVTDNEHCFSRKRPRIYRHVPGSICVPPISLNKLPLTPKSASPHTENYSRVAAVQTNVKTVHRGTSPGFAAYEGLDELNTYTETPALPGIRLDLATPFGKGDVSRGDIAQCKGRSSSPHSHGDSGRLRTKINCQMLEEERAKKLAGRNQPFDETEATMVRLQRPEKRVIQTLRAKPSAVAEDSSMLTDEERIPGDQSINSGCLGTENASNWTPSKEKDLVKSLRKRGVIFEDSSSESDASLPPPRNKPIPKDPLWQRPQSSTDLFIIAPNLLATYSSFDVARKRTEIAARPSRKDRRLNMSYLRQKRGENVHEEVERTLAPRMVKVPSIMTSELADSIDRNANLTRFEQLPDTEMTFGSFIGVPATPMPILTKNKQLAFRDGTRDLKGDLPRAREKFIVTNRSVACMEC